MKINPLTTTCPLTREAREANTAVGMQIAKEALAALDGYIKGEKPYAECKEISNAMDRKAMENGVWTEYFLFLKNPELMNKEIE